MRCTHCRLGRSCGIHSDTITATDGDTFELHEEVTIKNSGEFGFVLQILESENMVFIQPHAGEYLGTSHQRSGWYSPDELLHGTVMNAKNSVVFEGMAL